MKNSCVLIYEQDGDKVPNRTYVGIKTGAIIRDAEGENWGWITAEEKKKARSNAERVAKRLARQTGLPVKRDLWL